MSLCIDSESAVVSSIDESIQEVFQMMAGASLNRRSSGCRLGEITADTVSNRSAISVVMGLTGDLHGSLIISLESAAALQWTEGLIDHKTDENRSDGC